MIKNFRKSLILPLCVFISANSICGAIPPGIGGDPAMNVERLTLKFQNPGYTKRDEFGNLPIVYDQESDRKWDYRAIWVMNHAGAFGNTPTCNGVFRNLCLLFQTLVSVPQQGFDALCPASVLASGTGPGFTGILVGGTYGMARLAAAHAVKAKEAVFSLSRSLGLNEEVIYEALKNVAKWLLTHPGTVALIVSLAAIGFGVAVVKVCAKGKEFDRNVRNVTQLFQDMIQFLKNEDYKGGNLICYAIDRRELGFFSIFQSDLGTWIGPRNMPDLPNAVVDERYYGKFKDLANTIDTFFKSEGVARGLRSASEEEHSEV
jgi:hypothetical protein